MDARPATTVLLIEDNATDARLIQEALSDVIGAPFHLECVTRLSMGVERLAKGGVDVILLDLTLPDSWGLETFVKVHDVAPGLPIIVLTGLQDEAVAMEAVQRGAQDYLNKAHVITEGAVLVRAIRYAIERKRAEQELTRLASFLERNPNPIIELDADGQVTYVNPATHKQFPDLPTAGTDHPLLQGMASTLSALQPGERALLIREITVGKQVYEQHIFRDPQSNHVRFYIADITERKQVERLKDDFVHTVSHELRTPLATIKEFTAILKDGIAGPTTEDQERYLQIIQGNVDRLGRIINGLLGYATLESGRVLLDKHVVEVRPLVEHVVNTLTPLIEGKRLQLRLRLPEEPVGLFVDQDKLIQVLINLVDNAIKFTPEPGHVTISVEDRENDVQFQVVDSGIGIAHEDLPKLFEKFQQFQQLPSHGKPKGTGLGLAITKRLVELHGGRIWADSRQGLGSTFTFTLPKYYLEEVFKEYVKNGIARANQQQTAFSVGVLTVADFDHLKSRHGNEGTKQVLNEMEQLAKATVRQRAGDVVVRWQRGEIIVLAEVDQVGCRAMLERMKGTVEGHTYHVGGRDVRITVAASSLSYPEDASSEEEFVQRVEGRLQAAGRTRPRVLIIDDEPKVRRLLQATLALHEFEVFTAANGPDAIERLAAQPVDVIVLDILMPVMDGYQVYHLLKENPKTKDIPILMITGKGDRIDRVLGMEGPTYHYLFKPFRSEDLLAKIQELLQPRVPSPP